MKMKKILAVLTATVMAFSVLTGCADSGEAAPSSSASNEEAAVSTDDVEALSTLESNGDTIKIGLLTATTGSTALLDQYIENAFSMGVDEINAAGGVNGKLIELVREDYASDPATAAEKAEKLIVDDKVSAIYGVVLSSCRQAVLPIVEEYNSLLIYPTDYEGLEQSENIIYLGCIPNQQVATIAPWLVENVGKKIYVIGSDYIYPRSTCAQLISLLNENGAEIVGEEYIATDATDYTTTIINIMNAAPDVVYSVLVGDAINTFQTQYAQYGLDSKVFHMCMDETCIDAIGLENCEGVYGGQTYYCTVQSAENDEFVSKYQGKYNTVPTVYASTSYTGAYIVAEALGKAGDDLSGKNLATAFHGCSFTGPAGTLTIMDNNHTSLIPRIGQVNSDGLFTVVYEAPSAIAPDPWAGK